MSNNLPRILWALETAQARMRNVNVRPVQSRPLRKASMKSLGWFTTFRPISPRTSAPGQYQEPKKGRACLLGTDRWGKKFKNNCVSVSEYAVATRRTFYRTTRLLGKTCLLTENLSVVVHSWTLFVTNPIANTAWKSAANRPEIARRSNAQRTTHLATIAQVLHAFWYVTYVDILAILRAWRNVLRSGGLKSWSNGLRNCRARLARQWRSCSGELSRLTLNARS